MARWRAWAALLLLLAGLWAGAPVAAAAGPGDAVVQCGPLGSGGCP